MSGSRRTSSRQFGGTFSATTESLFSVQNKRKRKRETGNDADLNWLCLRAASSAWYQMPDCSQYHRRRQRWELQSTSTLREWKLSCVPSFGLLMTLQVIARIRKIMMDLHFKYLQNRIKMEKSCTCSRKTECWLLGNGTPFKKSKS